MFTKICALIAGLDSWGIPELTHKDLHCLQKHYMVGSPHSPYQVSQKQYNAVYPGCKNLFIRRKLQQTPFNVCPSDSQCRPEAHRCRGVGQFYCGQWGCKTTGDASWHPTSSWDLITVSRKNDSLNIAFTDPGKQFTAWPQGRTWGLRFYMSGWDNGFTFQIRLQIESPPTVSLGPDKVLAEQGPPKLLGRRIIPKPPPPVVTKAPTSTPASTIVTLSPPPLETDYYT